MNSTDIQMIFVIGIIFICFIFTIHCVIDDDFSHFFNFRRDLRKANAHDQKPPKKLEAEKVFLGKSNRRDVYLPTKHCYVCGTTGSGKTVAIANYIKACIDFNYPLLIVDGKGDTGENSMLDIVTRLKENRKLYVIDMNDPTSSHSYNPFFDTSSTIAKDMLINLSEWTEEHYKLNVERYLQRVVDLIGKAKLTLSFKTIVFYVEVNNFLKLSKDLVTKKVISKEEDLSNRELSKSSGEIAKGSLARFSTLLESDLSPIFSDEGIDIFSALKENAILLFILNPLIYPVLSMAIGKLIITDCKKAVAKFYKEPIQRRFFIFDEINVYASTQFLDLVNKSRSASITCVLASQSLSDLSAAVSEDFKEQVIENCNNYIIMRQNSSKNAEEWANIVGTRESIDVTYQIDEGATGRGSARKTREYILHPDEIKNFPTGQGFAVSKDFRFKCKVIVNKPF